MTIASSFAVLRQRLDETGDVLRQLALALDDVPDDDEPAVADHLRARAADVESDVRESLAASAIGTAAAAARCQQRLNAASRRLHGELASPETVSELLRAGGERGGAWERWSAVVREMLSRCQIALNAAGDALAGCWEEIADREVPRRQEETI